MHVIAKTEDLIDSIAASPLAMVISNPHQPDNPIEVANTAFCDLTGYAESEIVGRNCRFLAGEATEPWVTERIRIAIADLKPVLVDILNYRSDGSAFRNGVMVTPLFDENEKLSRFLGSQVDLGSDDALFGRREMAALKVRDLSPRQHQILTLMAKGLLNKQIAHILSISEKTVKMHRALLLERLDVRTSADAIRIAVEAGL